MAERLGNREAVDLLQKTLNEEKEADEKLTGIAGEILKWMDETSETNGAAASRYKKTLKAIQAGESLVGRDGQPYILFLVRLTSIRFRLVVSCTTCRIRRP
jgi:hypothetical protein